MSDMMNTLLTYQTAPLISGEKLSDFLIPLNWDESYNSKTKVEF